MKQNEKEPVAKRNHRRVFFGQLFAAVGGGLVGAGLLTKIFSSSSAKKQDDHPINVAVHPLAVPRAKEGSKSHA